ncbi:eukaryotic cytochrome b561-domain-containing protein [Morchella snyderi]|nr:eukaryotic cytochrome b561-domain-containing protein [Morchella snyderi]
MNQSAAPTTEHEPLLGRPGDVGQRDGSGLARNLITGTAPLAQVGGVMLIVTVWTAVLSHAWMVFSLHPLLNSLGVFLSLQAILVLQPTRTADQKRRGTYVHATFNGLAALSFFTALAIVIWHKQHSGIPHFESAHAYLGIVIYGLLFIQASVGFTQFFAPGIYGGVDNAKSMYKYHRVSGYVILLMYLVNIILASKLRYGEKFIHLKTWGVVLAGVLVVLGTYPRIKKQKIQIFG